jgi:hypothetical protein
MIFQITSKNSTINLVHHISNYNYNIRVYQKVAFVNVLH